MYKKLGAALLFVLILGVFVKLGSERQGDITLGGLFGLTGYVAFAGEASKNGFLMAIEDSELNVDYVIEDFQSDLTTVVIATNKLVNFDEVDVIIGPEWVEFAEVIVPIADKEGIPIISPWMTDERIISSSKHYFSATPSERDQMKTLVKHMRQSGIKNIGLINTNNAWSLGVSAIFQDELDGTGINIVRMITNNHGHPDFRTELTKLKSDDIDALMVLAGFDVVESLMKQIIDFGFTEQIYMPFSIGSTFEDPSLAEEGIYVAPKRYERTEEFNEKYKDRFGEEPSAISAATTYDMTTLVLNAIKEGAKTSEDIREYLANVKDYEGYSNVITFDENGQVAHEEVELRHIQGGKSVVIE
jgi:branched-chain amino acid transport system substrate-binding protein